MFSVIVRKAVASRPRWLPYSPLPPASAAMAMVAACRKSVVLLGQMVGADVTTLSRALFWTCWCSYCTLSSSASPPPILSSLDARSARSIAFRGPTFCRRRNPFFGFNSLTSMPSAPQSPRSTHTINNSIISSPSSNASKRLFSVSNHRSEETMSMELLANRLTELKYSKVIALVGAGASCSAGIPDFRTPGTGLYDQLSGYNLPFPEAIFDLDYYKNHPMPFVDLCQAIWPGQESGPKPTPSHHFLKLLEDKGLLHRIYTQNIDGLEALAGISTDKLVECHGHFRSSSCVTCRKPMPVEDCRRTMVEEGKPPVCEHCGSLVKPDIVFFGEEMPRRFQELIETDTNDCDLLLVFGTSLLVMPVAGIPSWVSPDCPRVLFNREAAGGIGGGGMTRQRPGDLFLKGDCDDSVQNLCELAGWTEELDILRALK